MRKTVKTRSSSGKRFRRISLITVIVATAIFAIGAVTVVSRQKLSNDPQSKSLGANRADKNLVTVRVASQDVHVDSQTGQIRDLTPEQAEKLAAGLKQMIDPSAEGLVETQHADGSVSLNLEDRFQNVTVARINKDGSLSQSCVDNPQAAGAFFGIDPKLIENRRLAPAKTDNQ